MSTAPIIPTKLNDKRLIKIDNLADDNEIYFLSQLINSDINFIYGQLKALRIFCSKPERIHIDAMIQTIERNKT